MNSSTFRHLQEVDSTNSEMKRWMGVCPDLQSFSFVSADFQSSGRGQVGNIWESERDNNLLASILYRPRYEMHVRHQFNISMAAALSVKSTVEHFLNISPNRVKVKWPNDVYVDNKKICGILIENSLSGANIAYSIIGIGLNVNQENFVSNAPNPVSMFQISKEKQNINDVSIFLQKSFCRLATLMEQDINQLHSSYVKALFRADNEMHEWALPDGTHFEAKIVDTLSTGHLILEDGLKNQKQFAFKEVSHVIALSDSNLLT